MLVKEMQGCEDCPLLNDQCKGGMTSSPGGEPIEPPCVSWDPDDEVDDMSDKIEADQLAYEEHLDREFENEQERKRKQKIKTQRAKESRYYVRYETQQINKLYKRIEANNSLQRLANAFSITNVMMNIKNEKPEQVKSSLEIENDKFRIEIEKIKKLKKQNLKELREQRK
jgi:hypothetical protein